MKEREGKETKRNETKGERERGVETDSIRNRGERKE